MHIFMSNRNHCSFEGRSAYYRFVIRQNETRINLSSFFLGYLEAFPDRSMNVRIKKLDNVNASGERKAHALVAAKIFKAGQVIYAVNEVFLVRWGSF